MANNDLFALLEEEARKTGVVITKERYPVIKINAGMADNIPNGRLILQKVDENGNVVYKPIEKIIIVNQRNKMSYFDDKIRCYSPYFKFGEKVEGFVFKNVCSKQTCDYWKNGDCKYFLALYCLVYVDNYYDYGIWFVHGANISPMLTLLDSLKVYEDGNVKVNVPIYSYEIYPKFVEKRKNAIRYWVLDVENTKKVFIIKSKEILDKFIEKFEESEKFFEKANSFASENSIKLILDNNGKEEAVEEEEVVLNEDDIINKLFK